jgi:hypothetical protein
MWCFALGARHYDPSPHRSCSTANLPHEMRYAMRVLKWISLGRVDTAPSRGAAGMGIRLARLATAPAGDWILGP